MAKVREVEYSRLFNLGNLNNERIGLRVAIDDSEDENTVIGQLFFKVLQIEEALQRYRIYHEMVRSLENHVRALEESIEDYYKDLANLEKRKKKLLEEEETKVKMCQILDIDEMIAKTLKRIEERKKEKDSKLERLNELKTYEEKIAELIKAGEFERVLSDGFSEEAVVEVEG